MNVQDIVDRCKQQQNLTGKPDASIMLLIRGKWGKTDKKKLFPSWKGSPIGQIVSDASVSGMCNVFFKANEVLAFLESKGIST